ncbi:MAG TPA: sigma factor, partial [Streptosporangiaceae bacterium]|nr:sigma factor [Streptosporangiaceae bacterium]
MTGGAPGRPATPGGTPDDRAAARRAVEVVWRIESARIVGALARYAGDFGLAEDVAQQALAEALEGWSRDGVPPHPAAWLLTVAR